MYVLPFLGTDPGPDSVQIELDSLRQKHAKLQQEYQRLLKENSKLKKDLKGEKFTYTNLDSFASTCKVKNKLSVVI